MSSQDNYEFTFRECFSEFFGILTIVYFTGWAMILYANDKIFLPEVAILTAAIYGVVTWTGISFSKAQYNPAITITSLITKKMTLFNALVCSYIGALIIFYTIPESIYTVAKDKNFELGCPHLQDTYNFFHGMVIEFLITFIVSFAYFANFKNQDTKYQVYPICFSYAIAFIIGSTITGGSANPFRYFGPALLSLRLKDASSYLIGSTLGGIVGGLTFEFMNSDKNEREEIVEPLQEQSEQDIQFNCQIILLQTKKNYSIFIFQLLQ